MDNRKTPIGPSPSDAELRALLHDYLFLELGSESQQLAFDDACDLLKDAPEVCWRFIELAAEADLTNEQAAYFAAGPVEDILSGHGKDFIERLEVGARRMPVMKMFAAAVWRGRMSDAVWARVLALRKELGVEAV